MTLVEFLRARLDEDESAIHAGPEPEDWCDRADGVHLNARRATAEVEAKRRIVDEYVEFCEHVQAAGRDYLDWIDGKPMSADAPSLHDGCEPRILEAQERWLRLLALPYADHEDYRQEWRPE